MRPCRSDVLLSAALACSVLAEALLDPHPPSAATVAIWVALCLTLCLRRRWPRTLAAVFALVMVPVEVLFPGPVIAGPVLWPLAVFGVAAYAPSPRAAWRDGLVWTAINVAVVPLMPFLYPGWSPVGLLFATALPIAGLAAGLALRDRSAELQRAEALLAAERAADRRRQTAAIERARDALATDIHAHVGRALDRLHGLVARAAEVFGSGGDARPELLEVRRVAGEAVERLAPVLRMLRAPEDEEAVGALAPWRGTWPGGRRVAVAVTGTAPLPALTRRVAEDGLAVLRKAGRGDARLAVDAVPGGVRLVFAGGLPAWPVGVRQELARLREAVAVAGGTLRGPAPWRRTLVAELPARLADTGEGDGPAGRDERAGAGPPGHREPALPRAGRLGTPETPASRGRVTRLMPVLVRRRVARLLPLLSRERVALLLPSALLVALGAAEVAVVDVAVPAWLRLLGAVLTAAPLVARRRAPTLAVALAIAVLPVRQALGDLGTPTISQSFVLYVCAFVAGAYARGARTGVAVAIVLAGGLGGMLAEAVDYHWTSYAYLGAIVLGGWAIGIAARRLVDEAAGLRAAQSALDEQRREAVRAAVRDERLRIARELHDVVGHSLTVVAVQAGAAAALGGRDREAARQAIASVREYLDAARGELRQLVRALGPASPTPAPRAADIVGLVERARRAGLPVALSVAADLDAMPPAVRSVLHRIVQEALTNVRRHAGRAPTDVAIAAGDGAVRVEVRNAAGVPEGPRGAGTGIAGMRDRAAALGGDLHAGPTGDGGFAVRATLPCGEVGPVPQDAGRWPRDAGPSRDAGPPPRDAAPPSGAADPYAPAAAHGRRPDRPAELAPDP
jgi:signal transduction histidine kinase